MTRQITGKAMMLDEIINYVQSLQRQVEVSVIELLSESLVKSQDFSSATTEPVCPCLLWIFQFLSMKLSAISPELNRDLDLRDVRLQSPTGGKERIAVYCPHSPYRLTLH